MSRFQRSIRSAAALTGLMLAVAGLAGCAAAPSVTATSVVEKYLDHLANGDAEKAFAQLEFADPISDDVGLEEAIAAYERPVGVLPINNPRVVGEEAGDDGEMVVSYEYSAGSQPGEAQIRLKYEDDAWLVTSPVEDLLGSATATGDTTILSPAVGSLPILTETTYLIPAGYLLNPRPLGIDMPSDILSVRAGQTTEIPVTVDGGEAGILERRRSHAASLIDNHLVHCTLSTSGTPEVDGEPCIDFGVEGDGYTWDLTSYPPEAGAETVVDDSAGGSRLQYLFTAGFTGSGPQGDITGTNTYVVTIAFPIDGEVSTTVELVK